MTQPTSAQPDAVQSPDERRAWRTKRINELRTELAALIDEEAHDWSYGRKLDLASLKAECLSMKKQGKVIAAIKHFRMHSGLGLREAKDAVDALN